MNWVPIVGKGFTPDEFEQYASSIVLGMWRPQFVVLHNTAVPTFADWHKTPGDERMKNLATYYRDEQKWHAGPHLFVADDLIWVFTPLTVAGVHSPSWNTVSWGVELVGDYEREPLSDAVRHNAVVALAALHRLGNLLPQSLRLHKEDPRTTHDCPGRNVVKANVIEQVLARLQPYAPGDHDGAIQCLDG